jgi:hypothetical protein
MMKSAAVGPRPQAQGQRNKQSPFFLARFRETSLELAILFGGERGKPPVIGITQQRRVIRSSCVASVTDVY